MFFVQMHLNKNILAWSRGAPGTKLTRSGAFYCQETGYNHHMTCTKCGVHTVPLPRQQAGFFTCMPCARQVQRPKGVMICTGKVGSEIQVLSAETYANNKAYLVARTKSVIKNFSRSICA